MTIRVVSIELVEEAPVEESSDSLLQAINDYYNAVQRSES